MNIVQLTGSLAVSAQITPEDVADIAARGYQILINNRPDGEEGSQPPGSAIAAAAEAAGMEYHYIPVTHGSFPGPDFDVMRELLKDQSRQVFAFCRSGTRCANLWVASVDTAEQGDATRVAGQLGFDLGMASKYLAGN